MKQLKNQRGLTLVELLAVVVILAIIAAIAAVAIGNVINNSRDKAALSDAVMILEGAKLADLDQACTESATGIECTADDLKNFVDADLAKYYGTTPSPVAKFVEAESEKGWQIAATKDMGNIKNTKYQPGGTKLTEGTFVAERAIKATLKQDKKE